MAFRGQLHYLSPTSPLQADVQVALCVTPMLLFRSMELPSSSFLLPFSSPLWPAYAFPCWGLHASPWMKAIWKSHIYVSILSLPGQ